MITYKQKQEGEAFIKNTLEDANNDITSIHTTTVNATTVVTGDTKVQSTGVVLTSPDSTEFLLVVSDLGALSATEIV